MAQTGPTKDGSDVTIILTARQPASDFIEPERRIVLTKESPIIRVGRASKVATKGFVAAQDNAWYDSPVMSRTHAELIADFNDKTVSIKDIKSLHGTWHQGKDDKREVRLSEEVPCMLEQGDLIRFGIDIYRSHQTFPPCRVDVKMIWKDPSSQPASTRAPSTNRFVVPDDDDDYDDEDFASIGDDKSVVEIHQPPIPVRVWPDSRPIDLTNDSPITVSQHQVERLRSSMTVGHQSSAVIDLTVDVAPPSGYCAYPDEDLSSIHSQSAPGSPSSSIYSSSDSDNPDIPTSPVHNHAGSTPVPMSPQYDTEEDSSSADDGPFAHEDVSESESESGSSEMDNCPQEYSDISEDEVAPTEALTEPMEYSDTSEDELAAAEVMDEEDNHDEHGARWFDDDQTSDSEASLEEHDADVATCHLPQVISASPPPIARSQTGNSALSLRNTQIDHAAHLPSIAPAPGICARPQPVAPMYYSPPCQFVTFAPSAPFNRQPSPSDAALARSDPIIFDATSHGPTAQALAERYGKHEYFAARDHNRATIMGSSTVSAKTSYNATAPDPNMQSTTVLIDVQTEQEPIKVNNEGAVSVQGSKAQHDSPSTKSSVTDILPAEDTIADQLDLEDTSLPLLVDSAWTSSGEAFLKEPKHCLRTRNEQRTRLQSPELDMTSAATFVESKKKPSVTEGRTRGLGIKDLLAKESKDSSPAPVGSKTTTSSPATTAVPLQSAATGRLRKRSFDEVFAEEETHTHRPVAQTKVDPHQPDTAQGQSIVIEAAGTSTVGSSPQVETTQPKEDSDHSVSKSEGIPATLENLVISNDPRPTKRRRLAHVAACAFGTLMGGAAVFAGMIATAPSSAFMEA